MKNALRKLWIPLFVGILILTVACKKDKNDDPEQTVLLKKVTWSDLNQSGEEVYEYDNQNRLITRTDKTNGAISVNTFSYNSSGKPSERVRSENGVESLKVLYTFTNNLITSVLHSKVDEQWVDVTKMEFTLDASGKITKLQSFNKIEGQYVSDGYQLQIWEGGNIVQQENWTLEDIKTSTIILELDDKNHPYNNFGIINGLIGFFKRNVKTSTIKNAANEIVSSSTNSHEYNEHNYPSKSWESKLNEENTTDPRVTYYEYIVR